MDSTRLTMLTKRQVEFIEDSPLSTRYVAYDDGDFLIIHFSIGEFRYYEMEEDNTAWQIELSQLPNDIRNKIIKDKI